MPWMATSFHRYMERTRVSWRHMTTVWDLWSGHFKWLWVCPHYMAIVMSLECLIPPKTCYIYGLLLSFMMQGGSIDMGGRGTSAPCTWNHSVSARPPLFTLHLHLLPWDSGLPLAKPFMACPLDALAHLLSQGSLLILLSLYRLGSFPKPHLLPPSYLGLSFTYTTFLGVAQTYQCLSYLHSSATLNPQLK